MSPENFILDRDSFEQLEFTELNQLISEYCHTKKAYQHYSEFHLSTEPNHVRLQLSLVYECWKYLKNSGSFDDDRWTDLSGADKSWSISNKIISADELLIFKKALSQFEFIYSSINAFQADYPNIYQLMCSVNPIHDLTKKLNHVMDDTGEIFDHATKTLADIRSELNSIQRKIQHKAADLLDQYNGEGILSNNQLTIKNGRLVLPVLAENKKRIPGFVHDVSGSGQTIFIEPQDLINLNNLWLEHKSSEYREIQQILSDCSDLVRRYTNEILQIEKNLVEFDIIHSKAKFLLPFEIHVPEIVEHKNWKIIGGIHPLLFLLHLSKNLTTVPLNFKLGENDEQVILISGPNAGGKSVTLKTVGLFQLMIQSGIPVPCSEKCSFPMVRSVFSVIGDKQSIQNDLSSFSGHITALRKIIDHAPKNETLILVDEICSGTDPIEGQALAVEVMLGFVKSGFRGVITSHYSELKKFAVEQKEFTNASMIFDTTTLSPTYIFRKGIPGSSYALELAKRIGFDENTIESARTRMGKENESVEKLNFRLEELINHNEKERELLDREKFRLTGLQNELDEKQKALKQFEKTYKSVLKKQVDAEVDQIRRTIFSELKNLKEQKISDFKMTEKVLTQKLEYAKNLLPELNETIPSESIKKGDRVKLKNGNQSGDVIEISGSEVLIQFDLVKLKVDISEIIPVVRQGNISKFQKPASAASTEIRSEAPYQQEIHLLGLTVPEALEKVELFLSQAVYHQYPTIRLVHGKGTGALRKAIHAYLSKHSDVKEFHLGEWYEGSTGATVVTLK